MYGFRFGSGFETSFLEAPWTAYCNSLPWSGVAHLIPPGAMRWRHWNSTSRWGLLEDRLKDRLNFPGGLRILVWDRSENVGIWVHDLVISKKVLKVQVHNYVQWSMGNEVITNNQV